MSDELRHYGVKGMRWGVRRYQNYDGSLTAAGKTRYSGEATPRRLRKYTTPTRAEAKQELKHLTMRAVKTLVPPVAIASLIKSVSDSRKYYHDGRTDYTKSEGAYEKLSELKKKTAPTTAEADARATNPGFGVKQRGKVNNCVYCSVAMEMRKRGYDVIARSRGHGMSLLDCAKWFKDSKPTALMSYRNPKESRKDWVNRAYDRFCRELESQGSGASGIVVFQWEKLGGGHALYYSVGSNGRVNFYDGQSGKSGKALDVSFSLADPSEYAYLRVDNCEINPTITESLRSNPKGGRS